MNGNKKDSHLLIQKIKNYGYLRGSIKLNVNRPIHITGYGDYLINKLITSCCNYKEVEDQVNLKEKQQQKKKEKFIESN